MQTPEILTRRSRDDTPNAKNSFLATRAVAPRDRRRLYFGMASFIAVASCLVLLVVPWHVPERAMTIDRIEYEVSELAEDPQRLTVSSEGLGYESHSNERRPESLGIGLYGRPAASGEMEAIERQIAPATLRSLPDHRGKVLAGDVVKRIRVTTGGDTIEKLVGSRLPIDPALQRVIDALDDVIVNVAKHPRRVLRMNVQNAALSATGEFSATVSFVGDGISMMGFLAPRGRGDAPEESVKVYWWPQIPGAPKSDVHVAPVTMQSVTSRPGALATFTAHSRLRDIPTTGHVNVQLRYLNMTPTANARTVEVGQLFSTTFVLP